MRKQCARFHFEGLFLIIFHAKLFRFIYTRVSATFAGLFQCCVSRFYYLRKCILFYSEIDNILTIVNCNQSRATKLFRDFIYVEFQFYRLKFIRARVFRSFCNLKKKLKKF